MRNTDYTDFKSRLHRCSEKRICLFIWLALFFLSSFSFAFGQTRESFVYSDGNRRDPFIPLVDKDGRYLLGEEELYSSDELYLSGILWDPQGKSSCLINNQIVRVGESVYGFMIKNISKDSVTVSKEGKEYIIRVSTEGEL
ncbi:MAG: pilus assembly protein PilP [Candidatus Omnitrophica bacterium]|nr:pilus assembly protein PilP [Candidatus Omnitrophota bacterium]